MATKTISITEEAYERLRTAKEPKESFSDVINKITGKRSLLELAGILRKDKSERLRTAIKESRSMSRERIERIVKNMQK